jgi:hypothetical protein
MEGDETMKKMTHALSSCRRLFLLTLASGITLTALLSTSPSAQAIAGRFCYYYSDASHTHQVGDSGYDCCGRYFQHGTVTQYSICGPLNCKVGCQLQ